MICMNLSPFPGAQGTAVHAISYSPNGEMVVASVGVNTPGSCGARAVLLDTKRCTSYDHRHEMYINCGIKDVVWSPDSTRVAALTRRDVVTVWKVGDGSDGSDGSNCSDIIDAEYSVRLLGEGYMNRFVWAANGELVVAMNEGLTFYRGPEVKRRVAYPGPRSSRTTRSVFVGSEGRVAVLQCVQRCFWWALFYDGGRSEINLLPTMSRWGRRDSRRRVAALSAGLGGWRGGALTTVRFSNPTLTELSAVDVTDARMIDDDTLRIVVDEGTTSSMWEVSRERGCGWSPRADVRTDST